MEFKRGYTLVEMVTVLAIIVILTSVFISFGTSKQKFILQRDIYIASENARRIQEMAMSIATIKLGDDCYGNKEIVPEGGFGIEMTSTATDTTKDADDLDDNNQKYWIYANCHNEEGGSSEYQANHTLGYDLGFDYASRKDTGESILNTPFIKLSSGVKITKIMVKKINSDGSLATEFTEINKIKILYTPPDPSIKICVDAGDGCNEFAIEAVVTITLQKGEESDSREIEFNKSGLISVKQK